MRKPRYGVYIEHIENCERIIKVAREHDLHLITTEAQQLWQDVSEAAWVGWLGLDSFLDDQIWTMIEDIL
jgi:hypothetical protein